MYAKSNNTFIWFLHYMLVQVWKLSKNLAKRCMQAQNIAKGVKIVSHVALNNIGKMSQYTLLIVKYVNKLYAES